MRLRRLVIKQFRNIVEADLQFSPGVNLLWGDNGQGKTSALEALYIAASKRYPSGVQDSDVVQWDRTWMDIRGEWTIDESRIGTSRYAVDRSSKPRRIKEGSVVPLVWFTPSDLHLIQGGPAYRRGFLDQVASNLYPRYAKTLRLYERAVAQKNRGIKEQIPAAALDAFNQVIASAGAVLWSLRAQTLDRLRPELFEVHGQLSGSQGLSVQLKPGGVDHGIPTDDAEVARHIHRRQGEERARLMSLVGPHRDELLIELNGHAAMDYASQGQQRTLALSLKLATYHLYREAFGQLPIVLLDDVLSELDPKRRHHLLELVSQGGQQTVVTDTEPRWYDPLHPTIYHVERGEFQRWT